MIGSYNKHCVQVVSLIVIATILMLSCSKKNLPEISDLIKNSSEIVLVKKGRAGFEISEILLDRNNRADTRIGAYVVLNLQQIHRLEQLEDNIAVFCAEGSVMQPASQRGQTEVPISRNGLLAIYKISVRQLREMIKNETHAPTTAQ